jgi:hypothetical protein
MDESASTDADQVGNLAGRKLAPGLPFASHLPHPRRRAEDGEFWPNSGERLRAVAVIDDEQDLLVSGATALREGRLAPRSYLHPDHSVESPVPSIIRANAMPDGAC